MFGITFCTSFKCPKRIHFGHKNDSDVIEKICPNCSKTYYESEKRKSRLILYFLGLLLLFLLLFFYYKNQSFIHDFFKPTVKVQTSFGLVNDSLYVDSIYVLKPEFEPQKREIRGNRSKRFESDTLPTSSPGNYRIIYTVNDTQYFKDIIIIPLDLTNDDDENIEDTPTPPDNIEDTSVDDETTNSDDPSSWIDDKEETDEIVTNTPLDGKTGYPKSPPDKQFDCQTIGKDFNAPCDDGNRNTTDDKIKEDCTCAGTPLRKYNWWSDSDGDGKGNEGKTQSTFDNLPPYGGRWVNNDEDGCPKRYAKTTNGCPNDINISNFSIVVDDSKRIPKVKFDPLPGDVISWESTQGIKVTGKNTISPLVEARDVGKQSVLLNLSSEEDEMNITKSIDICVKISDKYFDDLMEPIIHHGQYKRSNAIPIREKNAFKESLKLLDDIFDSNTIAYKNGIRYGNNIKSFVVSTIGVQESYVKAVSINRVKYNIDKCIIESINFEIKK